MNSKAIRNPIKTNPKNSVPDVTVSKSVDSDSPDATVSESVATDSESPELLVSENDNPLNLAIRTSIPSETIDYINITIGDVELSIAFQPTLNIISLKDEYENIESKIKKITDLTKEKILESSLKNQENISNIFGIDLLVENEWVKCDNDCKRLFEESLNYEQETAFYLLKIIRKSFMTIDNSKIVFVFDNPQDLKNFKILVVNSTGKATGDSNARLELEDYKKTFKVKQVESGNKVTTPPRLIMGFGPSASGKTYNAKKVITLLTEIKDFPKCFLTIDGGIYRECSMTFKALTTLATDIGIAGFSNLVITGTKERESLFYSTNIKNRVKEILKNQTQKMSLYVPETLSSCVLVTCMNKVEPYIELTGDKNWIGLMIYQHKDRNNCPYKDAYSCKGTIESGTTREKTEGKKYSSGAWDISYSNGLYMLDRAPGYRFLIHNSGSVKPSLFYDRTNYASEELREKSKKIIESNEYITFTDESITKFKLPRMNRWFRFTWRGLKKYGGRSRKTQKRVKRKMR